MVPYHQLFLATFPLLPVFPLHNLVRVADQLFQQFSFHNLHLHADPMLGTHVVGVAEALGGLAQFHDTLGLAFEIDGGEVVEVAVAEGVAADVKHQHGLAAGHLRKGQLFLHLPQRQAKLTEFFDVHSPIKCKGESSFALTIVFLSTCRTLP